MLARVFNVSNGDTVNFGGDFTKLNGAGYVGISGQAPFFTSIASTNIACVSLTLTSIASPAVSLAGDDVDVWVWGPGVAS